MGLFMPDLSLVFQRRPREPVGMTAAAQEIRPSPTMRSVIRQYDSWQEEAWGFWDSLGEFRFGVTWLAKLISRVRLVAAEDTPENDEPERLDSGPSVDLIEALGGGVGGQAQILKTLTVHLSVPGDSYLIHEPENEITPWRVYSTSEIRNTTGAIEVIDAEKSAQTGQEAWRKLPSERLIIRVWQPHARLYHMADSPARAALPTLRRLELINRRIQAELLSRVASNGVIIFPNEVALPTDPRFDDEDDPFMAEWIETASEAIKTPGTASSVLPMPVKMPGEFVEKVKRIEFASQLDERILAERDSEIRELATTLDIPAEILLGLGNSNHWTAWQIDEAAIKVPVSSLMETICYALTVGYLQPALKANSEPPAGQVVWYDTSEVTLRPDRSDNAIKVYDRLEISGEALRRETGFDETDVPTDDELVRMIQKKLAGDPTTGPSILAELGGEAPPVGTPDDQGGTSPPTPTKDGQQGPPGTEGAGPPPTDEQTPAARAASLSRMEHALEVTREGWRVIHPTDCNGECTVGEAAHLVVVAPGTPGLYRCWQVGRRLMVGSRTFTRPNGQG